MIRKSISSLTVLAVLGCGLSVHAGEVPRVRLLASTCVTCHGPGGHSLGAVPSLAGQDPAYLRAAMLEQREGKRDTTVMRKYMLGFTPEEIGQLADYFAKLK